MDFEEGKVYKKAGERAGFVFMFLVTGLILYLILSFLHKIPQSWNYIHICLLVGCIFLMGVLLRTELTS